MILLGLFLFSKQIYVLFKVMGYFHLWDTFDWKLSTSVTKSMKMCNHRIFSLHLETTLSLTLTLPQRNIRTRVTNVACQTVSFSIHANTLSFNTQSQALQRGVFSCHKKCMCLCPVQPCSYGQAVSYENILRGVKVAFLSL